MLVKFGSGEGFERAGQVLGAFDHSLYGRVFMVRTTTAVLQGQQFDTVPVDKALPCSLVEFVVISDREKRSALVRLDSFLTYVIQVEPGAEDAAQPGPGPGLPGLGGCDAD
jgi:hypothetical protein